MNETDLLVETLQGIVVFLFGLAVCVMVGIRFRLSVGKSMFLYGWHSIWCIAYLWYSHRYGADAIGYYEAAAYDDVSFQVGTTAVEYITSVLVRGCSLSLFGAFLFFNIFGSVGLLALAASVSSVTSGAPALVRLLGFSLLFMPSLSFWSSAIGKDALALMSVCLALWASLDLSRRRMTMVIALVVMGVIRPHIATIMLLSLVAAFVFDKGRPRDKLLIGFGFSLGAFFFLPFALRYVGLDDGLSAMAVIDYIDLRQGYNLDGGSSIALAEMSVTEAMFAYLFRPYLLESGSVFELVTATENLVLMGLAIMAVFGLRRSGHWRLTSHGVFAVVFALGMWVILATTTANLGIAARQKWMFVPALILLFLGMWARGASQAVLSPARGMASRFR